MTPAEALTRAAEALRSAEEKLAASNADLEARRQRLREAEAAADALSVKIAAADPDAADFPKLSADRTTARDRAEALRSQLATANEAHAQLGRHVGSVRQAHAAAVAAERADRIAASTAALEGALSKFLRSFAVQVAEHGKLLEEAGAPLGAPLDPVHPAFWERLRVAYLSSLPPGSPERARAERLAMFQGQLLAAQMNSRVG
jgi:predicted  nucleic acid-binding Zn-ribbon protein